MKQTNWKKTDYESLPLIFKWKLFIWFGQIEQDQTKLNENN